MEQANLFQSFPDLYRSNWHDSIHVKNVLCTPPQSNLLPFEDYKPLRATSSSFERNGEFDINNHPSPPDMDDWVSNTLMALENMPLSPPQTHKWTNDAGKTLAASAAFLPPLITRNPPHHLEIHGQTTQPNDLSSELHCGSQSSRTDSIPPEQMRASPQETRNRSSPPQAQQSPPKRRKTSPKATTSTATIPEKRTRRGRRPLGVSKEDGVANPAFSAKRESHLEKNRIAAHKCRQKKKEWVEDLEMQARELTAVRAHLRSHVAMLREQVLLLKNELLSHANCGCGRIDAYVNRTATQISPSSHMAALGLLGDIEGEKAEDKTELGDKDAFERLEDILKMDEGEG